MLRTSGSASPRPGHARKACGEAAQSRELTRSTGEALPLRTNDCAEDSVFPSRCQSRPARATVQVAALWSSRGLWRSPSAADAPDELRRGRAGDDVDALHAATAAEDAVAADDVVWCPVGSLHQHVGFEGLDQGQRRVLREDDDVIDGSQPGEHLRTLVDAQDRPPG